MEQEKNPERITEKALRQEFLTPEEGQVLFERLSLPELMLIGHEIRKSLHPGDQVTWIIDRNVNITNVCLSGCKFCNFYRGKNSREAYITTIDAYCAKIEEMQRLGGRQLLLQGGMHPDLGIPFYEGLFAALKSRYPELRLHALGPPEVVHLAKLEKCSYRDVLNRLTAAGMDSLPGAGAEILSDRVRKIVSPRKCTTGEWLEVMKVAHEMNLTTSATMMFGHVETLGERFQHLTAIRDLQAQKPSGSKGFLNFVPWPFQDQNTVLRNKLGVQNRVTAEAYIRMIAISRIMLPNIPHIQASWLTVGKPAAQLCLHAGANDFGSIMIEENVVSVAGANHSFDAVGIQQAIREAGFIPLQRDQDFQPLIAAKTE